MIVPTAPIVPRNKDSCIGPIRTFTYRVDDCCDPGWPGTEGRTGMIRVLASWYNPTHSRQLAIGDVDQYLNRGRDDLRPRRPKPKMPNCVWRSPEHVFPVHACCVVTPVNL